MAAIHRPLAQPWRPLRLPRGLIRANWWVIAAIVLAGASAMLPVLQNSSATSRGFRAQSLDARRIELGGQIAQLESEVARLTSLERIERRAGELGLGPTSDPIYISIDVPGPAPAKIASEYLPGPRPSGSQPEPWWRSLLGWLPPLD
ncbi:MAG: hypothetical protein ACR2HN_05190 [Tepidiformaceae bacterium]